MDLSWPLILRLSLPTWPPQSSPTYTDACRYWVLALEQSHPTWEKGWWSLLLGSHWPELKLFWGFLPYWSWSWLLVCWALTPKPSFSSPLLRRLPLSETWVLSSELSGWSFHHLFLLFLYWMIMIFLVNVWLFFHRVVVYVDSVAAGYNLLQLGRGFISAKLKGKLINVSYVTLPWVCFLLDQVCLLFFAWFMAPYLQKFSHPIFEHIFIFLFPFFFWKFISIFSLSLTPWTSLCFS